MTGTDSKQTSLFQSSSPPPSRSFLCFTCTILPSPPDQALGSPSILILDPLADRPRIRPPFPNQDFPDPDSPAVPEPSNPIPLNMPLRPPPPPPSLRLLPLLSPRSIHPGYQAATAHSKANIGSASKPYAHPSTNSGRTLNSAVLPSTSPLRGSTKPREYATTR